MRRMKENCLQEAYIGQKIAELLAIDYDENQLLATEFSDKAESQRKESSLNVK